MRAFLSCYAITRLAVLVVVALLDCRCRCHIAKFIVLRRLLGAALLECGKEEHGNQEEHGFSCVTLCV